MKNDNKINDVIEKIRYSTEEFLYLPNMCAYSDSIAERIIDYSRELERLIEKGFNDG